MAQEAVNAVVQALTRGFESVAARKQAQQELEERQREADLNDAYRQSELAHQKAVLDAQTAQQEVQNKANERLYNLQKLPILQQMAERYASTGVAPPGSQITPTDFSQYLQTTQQPSLGGLPTDQTRLQPGVSGVSMTLPGDLGVIPSIPTPEEQAARMRVLSAPAEEAKTREAAALQASELQKALTLGAQQHQQYLEILGRQEDFQNKQRQQQEAFQRGLANDRNSLQLTLAGIKAGGSLGGGWGGHMETDEDGNPTFVPNDPSKIISSAVNDARDGKLTLEAAKKEFNAKQFPQVDMALKNQGYSWLSQKDQDKIKELEPIAGLVSNMYDLFKLRLDHPLSLNIPSIGGVGGQLEQYNALRDQVGKNIAGATSTLNNIKRFNGLEASKMEKALTPNPNWVTSSGNEEFKKYEAFTKDMQDLFNSYTSGLPESQRNIIRQNLGFNSFPYLGSTVKTPGAPIGAIPGATPPSPVSGGTPITPTGPKPGQIYVKKKATGQEGWMSRQYYDPSKYDMAKPPGAK